MSEENVEIVRRLFEAVARRDSATVLALYDPDVEWDGSRHQWAEILEGPAIFHGHDGLRVWARNYYETWENLEDNIEELIDAGDSVVSIVTTRARGRGSGIDVELKHNAGVWTLRDGRVVRVQWLPNRKEALEAAGLSE
jgi:ketosteroid isomerase-like protein